MIYCFSGEKKKLKKFYVIRTWEFRYSSVQNFQRLIFEITGLFNQPIPSQPLPAGVIYSESNGKACI